MKKCIICEKELVVFKKQHGAAFPSYKKWKRTFCYADSKDGVLFMPREGKKGFWFCNTCWKKIISKVKFKT